MRVAVVMPELDPSAGGGFSFQAALHDALRELEGETRHELLYVVPEIPERLGPYARLPMNASAHLRRAAIGLIRDGQDRMLGMARRFDPATDFERLLDRHRIDLVWFSTPWALDCDRPYLFSLWDMGYRQQPWFPELSGAGEFARFAGRPRAQRTEGGEERPIGLLGGMREPAVERAQDDRRTPVRHRKPVAPEP